MKHVFGNRARVVLCLALLLALACMGMVACAPDLGNQIPDANVSSGDGSTIADGVCDDGLIWTLYANGELQLTGTSTEENGEMHDYAAYKETAPWMAYADQITGLTITDGVTNVADEAFAGLKKLIWVQFGGGVTEIGKGAFKNCTNLRRVILPTNVTTISESAFAGCYRLWEVQLNEGLTTIGANAFSGCYSLLTVGVPSTLTNSGVASTAFSSCEKILEVVTTQSITTGSNQFGGVAKTAKIVSATELTKDENGFQFWAGRVVGYQGTETDITIPATSPDGTKVATIAPYAFYANTALTSVTIHNEVTVIGKNAFQNCQGLTTVTIGTKVNTIGQDAFAGCIGLTTLNFNATNCSQCATGIFSDSMALTTVSFGSGVTLIPAGLLKNNTALTAVTVPASVTEVGASAFENCTNLKTVTLAGKNLKTVGESAFRGCTALSSFNFANLKSGTTIGASAFQNCTSLVLVDLSNVQRVGNYTFSGCISLTSVVVGSSTNVNSTDVFRGCEKLVDVVWNKTTSLKPGATTQGYIAYYTEFSLGKGTHRVQTVGDGFLFMTVDGKSYLVGYLGTATALTLPANYSGNSYEVYRNAFNGNGKITSVTLGSGVTAIGDSAFANCLNLKSVNAASSAITSIGAEAFSGCSAMTTLSLPQTTLTTIGEKAFAGCGVTTLTVPNSVTSLGESAFANSGLVTVILGTGVTQLPKYLFNGSKDLTSVGIAAGTTEIGYGTFANCSSLKNVTLPVGLVTIEDYAFYGCSALRTVSFPATVTSIGYEAYKNCYSLYSLTLGAGLTSSSAIGTRAFQNCEKLVEVINHSTITLTLEQAGPGLVTNYAEIIHTGTTKAGAENDYIYIVLDGKTYMAGYVGTETTLVLPDKLNGQKYDILAYAFYGSNLVSVKIPYTVGEIGLGAFRGSDKLTTVVVKATKIGAYAFADCTALTSLTIQGFNENGTTAADLADGVKTVGAAAFQNCVRLETLDLTGTSVEKLGGSSFRGCIRLTTVKLASTGDATKSTNKLTTMGAYIFDDCTSLVNIIIPKSVKSVGRDWASNCPKLAQVLNLGSNSSTNGSALNYVENKLTQNNDKIVIDENGFVFLRGTLFNKLVAYVGEKKAELVLPEKFDGKRYEIHRYAFWGCDWLESIVISSGVSAIGEYAFAGTSLKTIYLPATVNGENGVGENIFYGCSKTLLVVCGHVSQSTLPANWDAEWNVRSTEDIYNVFYGYTVDQYNNLIGK